MVDYQYSSAFTGRLLHSRDVKLRPVQVVETKEEIERKRKLGLMPIKKRNRHQQGQAKTLSEARYENNQRIREKLTRIRIKHGFVSEIEAKGVPFRSFNALDNLVASDVPDSLKKDQALERIRREHQRQRAKNRSLIKGGIERPSNRCRPDRTSTAARLRTKGSTPPTIEEKLEEVERSLSRSFIVAAGKKSQADHDKSTKDDESRQNTFFNGIFQKKENKKKEKPAPPQVEEAPQQAATKPAWANAPLINTRQQRAFLFAAKRCNIEDLKTIFRENRNHPEQFHVDGIDLSGLNALHWAASYGQIRVLRLLIKFGANWRTLTAQGQNVFQVVDSGVASDPMHPNHSKLPACAALFKDTKIFRAAQLGDTARVAWLMELGDDINDKNAYGMTPLHYAYMGEHLDTCVFLIGHGAKVVENKISQYPTDLASERFCMEVDDKLNEETRLIEEEKARLEALSRDDFDDL